jgi:hypothetical protein
LLRFAQVLKDRARDGRIANLVDDAMLQKSDGLRCHQGIQDIADQARVTRSGFARAIRTERT